jgi:hypothetical protein
MFPYLAWFHWQGDNTNDAPEVATRFPLESSVTLTVMEYRSVKVRRPRSLTTMVWTTFKRITPAAVTRPDNVKDSLKKSGLM